MKKIILYITLFCVNNSEAQTYEFIYKINDPHFVSPLRGPIKSLDEKASTFKKQIASQSRFTEIPNGYSSHFCAFDKNNNLIENIIYKTIDSPIQIKKYVYQNDKILVANETFNEINEAKEIERTMFGIDTFFYNKAGMILEKRHYYKPKTDTTFSFTNSVFYYYTPNGLLAYKENSVDKSKVIYTYDNNKNVLEEHAVNYILKYKYDSKNRVIEKLRMNNNELREKFNYTYYKNNNLKSKYHFADKDFGNWEYLETYQYDKNKNVIESKINYNIPKKETIKSEHKFKYDKQGNWIKRTTTNSNLRVEIITRNIIYYQ